MRLTSTELSQALDRAIDRGVRRVLADDWRLESSDRFRRLRAAIRAEVDELQQNLYDNDQGVVLFEVDLVYRGPRVMPGLHVTGGRLVQERRGQPQ